MVYRFGDYVLDTAKFELRERGVRLSIEPQVLRLLQFLMENRDRVVSRREIHRRLWGRRLVTDNALTVRIRALRSAVGDSGRTQNVIQTIHSTGYRFVAEVESAAQLAGSNFQAVHDPSGNAHRLADSADRALSGPPSIAVLPFECIGGDDVEENFARGLAHDLITRVARSRTMLIIARGSALRFASGQHDISEIGNILGVRYVVQGAIQISNSRLKVFVALANTTSCEEIWSDSFTRSLDDFMLLQEEISGMIVGSLESSVQRDEMRRALLMPSSNLDAWSAFHRGLHHMYRFKPVDCDRAERLFRRSIDLEPNVPRAYAGLSFVHFERVFMHFDSNRSASIRKAFDYAEQSLAIDPLDPMGHWVLARAQLLGTDLEASRSSLETAIELNPSYATAKYSLGWVAMHLGENDLCIDSIGSALRLSPYDPLIYAMHGVLALNLALMGRPSEAITLSAQSMRQPNAHYQVGAFAAVTHALGGQLGQARDYWEKVQRAKPGYDFDRFLSVFPFRRESDIRQIRKSVDAIQARGRKT